MLSLLLGSGSTPNSTLVGVGEAAPGGAGLTATALGLCGPSTAPVIATAPADGCYLLVVTAVDGGGVPVALPVALGWCRDGVPPTSVAFAGTPLPRETNATTLVVSANCTDVGPGLTAGGNMTIVVGVRSGGALVATGTAVGMSTASEVPSAVGSDSNSNGSMVVLTATGTVSVPVGAVQGSVSVEATCTDAAGNALPLPSGGAAVSVQVTLDRTAPRVALVGPLPPAYTSAPALEVCVVVDDAGPRASRAVFATVAARARGSLVQVRGVEWGAPIVHPSCICVDPPPQAAQPTHSAPTLHAHGRL